MHYAFDRWAETKHPSFIFERYADDVICHCHSEKVAREFLDSLENRLDECGLTLHPKKTKIIYCKDYKRPGTSKHISFDFLGFTFRPRSARSPKTGNLFVGFNPGVSNKALKRMGLVIRRWNIHRRSDKSLVDLGRMFNPILRGWINYFGWVNKGVLVEMFKRLDLRLARSAMNKYKKLRRHKRRARLWMREYVIHNPGVSAHWQFSYPGLTG